MKLRTIELNEIDFASQGNAILGIRDSGKTYTATWFAERLLDAHIPFVDFDPIGGAPGDLDDRMFVSLACHHGGPKVTAHFEIVACS